MGSTFYYVRSTGSRLVEAVEALSNDGMRVEDSNGIIFDNLARFTGTTVRLSLRTCGLSILVS